MDEFATLESMGFTLPSPAYLFAAIVFGIIGWVAYRFGKKTERHYVKWLGLLLMLYPYAISSTLWLYVIGCALCGACYYFKDH